MTDPSPTQAAVIKAYGTRLRALDRWVLLHASCITEIQDAVADGRLNANLATEFARLPQAAQAEVFALGLPACRSVARELQALRARWRCPTCRQSLADTR